MQDTDKQHGPSYMMQGFSMLLQPGIKRFVFIPLAINVVIYALLFMVGYHYLHEAVAWIDHFLPHWLAWLNWILWPLFLVAGLIFLLYTFTLIANIIAAPFNSFLSDKVEELKTGNKAPSGSIGDALKEMPRAIGREWKKLKYYVPRALLLLVLSFVPGLNAVSGILWFVFGSWMMAIQYLDYPMDNHKVPFDNMLAQLHEHGLQSLAFGAVSLIFSLIPILNLVAMPSAVIGATLKYLDYHHEEKPNAGQTQES